MCVARLPTLAGSGSPSWMLRGEERFTLFAVLALLGDTDCALGTKFDFLHFSAVELAIYPRALGR